MDQKWGIYTQWNFTRHTEESNFVIRKQMDGS
jgi:hypothetical protein